MELDSKYSEMCMPSYYPNWISNARGKLSISGNGHYSQVGHNKNKMRNRIKELREHAGLSQDKLAKQFGINVQGMGKIEKRPPEMLKVKDLEKLARIFGVNPWDVVDGNSFASSPESKLAEDVQRLTETVGELMTELMLLRRKPAEKQSNV